MEIAFRYSFDTSPYGGGAKPKDTIVKISDPVPEYVYTTWITQYILIITQNISNIMHHIVYNAEYIEYNELYIDNNTEYIEYSELYIE